MEQLLTTEYIYTIYAHILNSNKTFTAALTTNAENDP